MNVVIFDEIYYQKYPEPLWQFEPNLAQIPLAIGGLSLNIRNFNIWKSSPI